jgi:hypothetical protein
MNSKELWRPGISCLTSIDSRYLTPLLMHKSSRSLSYILRLEAASVAINGSSYCIHDVLSAQISLLPF